MTDCKINHDDGDELTIPRFLCVHCSPRKEAPTGQRPATNWVDPVEQRQRELRAAQAETAKAKRTAALEKHKQNIADRHAGEEWNRKLGCWERTDRSMAKYEAQLQAEFEAAKAEEAA